VGATAPTAITSGHMTSDELLDGTIVGVVIVTYDPPPGVLEASVASVVSAAALSSLDVRVVVVDTGGKARRRLESADAAFVGRVEIVDSADNFGFGAAVNDGFRSLLADGADAVACLNDDIVVRPGWLEPLVDMLGSDGALGAVQPLLVWADRPDTINSAGVDVDRYGAVSDLGRDQPVSAVSAAAPVPAVTGGAALFGRAFLSDVGGFDERFFLYYENVELCQRGRRAGWSFAVQPESIVRHVGGASTAQLGGYRLALQERNRLWCTAMQGTTSQIASAWWLSIRRLRHAPNDMHRRALVQGTRGALPRLVDRVRGRQRIQRLEHAPAGRRRRDPLALRPLAGVNVLGYHQVSSGLGDAGREFVACLEAAGVDVVAIDNDISQSPHRRAANEVPERLFDTTVSFVTGVEFEYLPARYPMLFGPGKRVIGYWFWELATIPDRQVGAMAFADEIWTATSFVHDAYAAVAPPTTDVRLAPLRLPQPTLPMSTDAWRARFGGSFTFLVSFDYLSVPERKNPHAAIRAFRDAFPDDDDVALYVKTLNRDARADVAAEVEAVAHGDERVTFLDAHLDEHDHHALIAAADCLVSPHRSEGLGLQPALAMWLGTPVIATRYGGVLDICDETTALLCDYELVEVVDGGGIYPPGSLWADVSHDQLVVNMRRVRTDPRLRHRLVDASRERIESEPSRADLGQRYVRMLTELRRHDR